MAKRIRSNKRINRTMRKNMRKKTMRRKAMRKKTMRRKTMRKKTNRRVVRRNRKSTMRGGSTPAEPLDLDKQIRKQLGVMDIKSGDLVMVTFPSGQGGYGKVGVDDAGKMGLTTWEGDIPGDPGTGHKKPGPNSFLRLLKDKGRVVKASRDTIKLLESKGKLYHHGNYGSSTVR